MTHRIRGRRTVGLLLAGALAAAGGAGCNIFGTGMGFVTPKAPEPPADSLILSGDTLVEQKPPEKGSPEAKLAGAHELFRREEYDKAADLYHDLANQKKFPERVVLEACFREAECYRLQNRLPKAADTYSRLMKIAPSNPYREQALKHMYDIADYWLEDTRERMKQTLEVKDGKRWLKDQQFVHFAKDKPLTDEEGRAVEKLEQVHYNDITNSLGLADRALFLAGAVKFFNEDYREADHYLTMIHETYPNSKYAPRAAELAVISKHMSTGGPDYDSRKVAEARILIDSILRNYPKLANEKGEFFNRQLAGIAEQEAHKDLRLGDFYRRTGHPTSAWFYYDLVCRRYPGTTASNQAQQKLGELRVKAEKEGKSVPTPGSRAPGGDQKPPAEEVAPPPRTLPDEIAPPPQAVPPPPLPPGVK